MGFRLPAIRRASSAVSQESSKAVEVPKGYLTVYVGDKMKRGGLTIPCKEDAFMDLITSCLNGL
ncbi:hypothetical protein Ahy_A04g018538 [Arachis hypogaea]|uniref:Auxin-induced protein n=1 Tax=Arachis hypogaea TaxID=3818 RepID=A0A445DDV9_ARAHY|nr:hypothetical protein Ahy_A04g018538 [Arachis hypogaea]